MTVSSTMLVLNKAVLKAIPAPTTGTVTLDLYAPIQAQPLVQAYPKSNTSPHASPLSLIASLMSPTLRFPRFRKCHHSTPPTSCLLYWTAIPKLRFPASLNFFMCAYMLQRCCFILDLIARAHTHTHTLPRPPAHTHTHTSVLLFQVGSSAIILWVLGKTGKRAWCGV